MEYVEPVVVGEAARMLAADPDGSLAIAGGTAVVLMLRQGLIAPERLVSLRRVAGLRGIHVADGVLRIGALTSLTEVGRSPLVRKHAPSVAGAASVVANPRIRNAATLGGNLAEADYASDPPAALISWRARCAVQGPGGPRSIEAGELVTGHYTTVLAPGEVITAVEIPLATGAARSAYLKFRSRSSEDRPCVGVAARVVLDGDEATVAAADVVVGAVSAVPHRSAAACRELEGAPLDQLGIDRVAEAYAEAVDPIEDSRGSAWYRRRVIRVLVRRALGQLAAGTAVAA